MQTYFNRILHVFVCIAVHSGKEIHTQLRDDSLLSLFLFAHHRKGLSGSRLAVGKDTNVVS